MKNSRKEIGAKVLANFEKKVTDELFSEKLYNKRIETAAEIAEEMPFVTMPFREHGILRKGERNTKILHIFRPNLWAQDYAYEVGKLDKMTVNTAVERGEAVAGYVLETSPNLRKILADTGTDIYTFFDANREAAMAESAYYTRLGGGKMSETARKKIDTALMRRAIRDESMFKTILKHVGVDEKDGLALFQFSEEMDLTEILQKFVEIDPYYNRRIKKIEKFTEINSEVSITLPQTKTSRFVEELLIRLGRKHPAMIKRIANAVGQ